MSETNINTMFFLHEVINDYLHHHHMSLRELSVRSEIPYSTIYSWSLGGRPKDLIKLKKLADSMLISLDQLIFKTTPKIELEDSKKIELKIELIIKKEK